MSLRRSNSSREDGTTPPKGRRRERREQRIQERESERSQKRRQSTLRWGLGGLALALFLVFLGYAVFLQVAKERPGISLKDLGNLHIPYVAVEYDCPEDCPELVDQLGNLIGIYFGQSWPVFLAPFSGIQDEEGTSHRISASTQDGIVEYFDEFDPQGIGAFIEDNVDNPGYNSSPPTSGPHLSFLAPTGISAEPIPAALQTHNLEDGHINVQYDCRQECPDLVEQLSELVQGYLNDGRKILMAPYPGILDQEGAPHRIALTAWTRIDIFDEFDRDRIKAFVEAYENIDHHVRGL